MLLACGAIPTQEEKWLCCN